MQKHVHSSNVEERAHSRAHSDPGEFHAMPRPVANGAAATRQATFRCPVGGGGHWNGTVFLSSPETLAHAQPVRNGAKANGAKALRGWRDWLSNGATCAGPWSGDSRTHRGRERQRLPPGEEHSSCLKRCEIRRYRVGGCVSHLSPPSASPSLTPPVAGAIGRGNRCCRRRPAISAHDGRKKAAESKGQITSSR